MPIVIQCQCGKKLQLKEDLAGKRVRCTGCGEAIDVPLKDVTNRQSGQTKDGASKKGNDEPSSGNDQYSFGYDTTDSDDDGDEFDDDLFSGVSDPYQNPGSAGTNRKGTEERELERAGTGPKRTRSNLASEKAGRSAAANAKSSSSGKSRETVEPNPDSPPRSNVFIKVVCGIVVFSAVMAAGIFVYTREASRAAALLQSRIQEAETTIDAGDFEKAVQLLAEAQADPGLTEEQRTHVDGLAEQLRVVSSKEKIQEILESLSDAELKAISEGADIPGSTNWRPAVQQRLRENSSEILAEIRKIRNEQLVDSETKAATAAEIARQTSLAAARKAADQALMDAIAKRTESPESIKEQLAKIPDAHPLVIQWAQESREFGAEWGREIICRSLMTSGKQLATDFPEYWTEVATQIRSTDATVSDADIIAVISDALADLHKKLVQKARERTVLHFDRHWEEYQNTKFEPGVWLGDANALESVLTLLTSRIGVVAYQHHPTYCFIVMKNYTGREIKPLTRFRFDGVERVFDAAMPVSRGERFFMLPILDGIISGAAPRTRDATNENVKFLDERRVIERMMEQFDDETNIWDTIVTSRADGELISLEAQLAVRKHPTAGWICRQTQFLSDTLEDAINDAAIPLNRGQRFQPPQQIISCFSARHNDIVLPARRVGRRSEMDDPYGGLNLVSDLDVGLFTGAGLANTIRVTEDAARHNVWSLMQYVDGKIPSATLDALLPFVNTGETASALYSDAPTEVLHLKLPAMPPWLVFEDRLDLTVGSTAGDVQVLSIEVLPKDQIVGITCAFQPTSSGTITAIWKDSIDASGPTGQDEFPIQVLENHSLKSLAKLSDAVRVTKWRINVEKVTEKTTLQGNNSENELVLEIDCEAPVFGMASFPDSLAGKDAMLISGDEGTSWLRWGDRTFANGLKPTIFPQPVKKVMLKAMIPPNTKVPLDFLFSDATTVWVEKQRAAEEEDY